MFFENLQNHVNGIFHAKYPFKNTSIFIKIKNISEFRVNLYFQNIYFIFEKANFQKTLNIYFLN